jgi:hypothetical protein
VVEAAGVERRRALGEVPGGVDGLVGVRRQAVVGVPHAAVLADPRPRALPGRGGSIPASAGDAESAARKTSEPEAGRRVNAPVGVVMVVDVVTIVGVAVVAIVAIVGVVAVVVVVILGRHGWNPSLGSERRRGWRFSG